MKHENENENEPLIDLSDLDAELMAEHEDNPKITNNAAADLMAEVNLVDRLTNPRAWVQHYLTINNITITPGGGFVLPEKVSTKDERKKKKPAKFSDVAGKSWLDYRQAQLIASSDTKQKMRTFTITELEMALKEYADEVKKKTLPELQTNLATSGEDLTHITKWVSLITNDPAPSKLNINTMAHWLWSVKRKLNGLPVSNHIMPIIYSQAQGIGKSEAVKKLIAPLKLFVTEMSVRMMTEERLYAAYEDYLVVFSDEMAHAAKADSETVKHIITAEYVSYRPMGSNEYHSVQQNCSFIGTSNKSLELLFNDPTGLRRFYQIDASMPATLSDRKKVWAQLNQIDYLALWKGIDETKNEGYLFEVYEELKSWQAERVTKQSPEMFAEENDFKADDNGVFVKNDTLYNLYVAFCNANGFKPYNAPSFGRTFSTFVGAKSAVKKIDGKAIRGYYLAETDYTKKLATNCEIAEVLSLAAATARAYGLTQ